MNRVVLWLLARRRLHRRPARALVGLRVRGRRSGVVAELPVQYARDEEGLVLMPGHHDRKRWWRNLVRRSPVQVLWEGRWVEGTAWVLWAWDAVEYRRAREVYLRRFPHVIPDHDQPFVRVAFDHRESSSGPDGPREEVLRPWSEHGGSTSLDA